MKSVSVTIMIFIGISVILYNDWLSLLAQESVYTFALYLTVFMLLLSVIVLCYVAKKQKGGHHDKKDKHLA